MTEKIERLGAGLEARDKVSCLKHLKKNDCVINGWDVIFFFCQICDQQLVELKELYDAEQRLSAELGEKLGKTQVSFQSESSGFTVLANLLLITSVLSLDCRKIWRTPRVLCMI